jgi:hypothetical protein
MRIENSKFRKGTDPDALNQATLKGETVVQVS